MLSKGKSIKAQQSWFQTYRMLIALGVAVFFGLLVMFFVGSSENNKVFPSSGDFLDSDRARHYNVKVLPNTLTDADLASLPKTAFSYIAMVDAGSSGCRAHVYRYGKLGSVDGDLYVLPAHNSYKVKPGLSTFEENPEAAGNSLQGLVDFLKEQVPEEDWATTPFYLKATAGLRMLEPQTSEAILQSVRAFLGDRRHSPFMFHPSWAKIIPGSEEGGFGWLAFNYLKKVVGPKRATGKDALTPYAVVEMGGASAQVSQAAVSEEEKKLIPEENKLLLELGSESYTLFTHSFLGYGAEQARAQVNEQVASKHKDGAIIDPCLNGGWVREKGTKEASGGVYAGPEEGEKQGAQGSSTEVACVSEVAAALFPSQPTIDKCKSHEPPFSCVAIPNFVRQSENFLLFENFFYTASAIGVADVSSTAKEALKQTFPLTTTPTNFAAAGEKVCKLSWSALGTAYPVDGQDKANNIKWCFAASFMTKFLLDGLKLDPTRKVTVQKDVGDSEIEWALGAAYKEASDLLKRTHLRIQ